MASPSPHVRELEKRVTAIEIKLKMVEPPPKPKAVDPDAKPKSRREARVERKTARTKSRRKR